MTEPQHPVPALDPVFAPHFRGHCRGCQRPMVTQRIYLAHPDQRAGQAYLMGYSLCSMCHDRARRAGTLPFPAPATAPARPPRRRLPPGSWFRARADALRDMKETAFAPLPRVCEHDNGIDIRRDTHTATGRQRPRPLKLECHECGQHLGYTQADNPAPCTAAELAAYSAAARPAEPWTWGVTQYMRVAPRWLRPKAFLLELPPTHCPQGHELGPITPDQARHSVYTCRLCHLTDPHTATWRPARAPHPARPERRPAPPQPARAVVWCDGTVHPTRDTWSNMALRHHQRTAS